MKLIVCVDDNFGISFNKRRQSFDTLQMEDVKKIILNKKVYLTSYTYDLYKSMDLNFEIIDEDTEFLNDSFFIYEGDFIEKVFENVTEIICYYWNRNYPFDKTFEDFKSFKEIDNFSFKGKSHDKITRKKYVKENLND